MDKATLHTKQPLKKLNKIHLLISPFVFIDKILNKLLSMNNVACFKILKLFLKEKHSNQRDNNDIITP